MPASSKMRAVSASYAVIMGHFSPRAFAAIRSRVVTRRPVGSAPYRVGEVDWGAPEAADRLMCDLSHLEAHERSPRTT